MTKEQIKESVSMREAVERYGIHINRRGFCKCPFHTEKTASMKIYNDSFYCFGCEKSGDIFTFVQNIENCDFKTAFHILGGDYSHNDNLANVRILRNQKRKETKQIKLEKLKKEIDETYRDLHFFMKGEQLFEPYSDNWCYCVKDIEYLRYKATMLDREWEKINNGTTSRL